MSMHAWLKQSGVNGCLCVPGNCCCQLIILTAHALSPVPDQGTKLLPAKNVSSFCVFHTISSSPQLPAVVHLISWSLQCVQVQTQRTCISASVQAAVCLKPLPFTSHLLLVACISQREGLTKPVPGLVQDPSRSSPVPTGFQQMLRNNMVPGI